MQEREVDAIVVGMGPGGEEVAGRLAEAGLNVVGIEANLLGGECPYWGCVPSKMMIRAANVLAEARRVNALAGTAEVHPDWSKVATRIRDEATDNWDDRVAVERFEKKGGHFVRGSGRLLAANKVQVGDVLYVAQKAVVLATGASAFIPDIEGLQGTPYWTNRDAIEVKDLPASLAILGGGAIGVELGQVFARFGVKVSIVEAADRLVAREEPETSRLVQEALTEDGVDVRVGVKVQRVAYTDGTFQLEVENGDAINAEKLLVAIGRRPDLSSLGLESIGLDVNGRGVPVDEYLRVVPGVWAVGDVTGIGAFTHISMYQARIAIADILGKSRVGANYAALPRVTFTDPEVGSVGLSESDAREKLSNIQVGMSQIPDSTRGWIHKVGNAGFIKLVVDAEKEIVVGATSAGPTGGEVLAMLTLAIHEETPISHLREMIYAYPTFHRAIEPALQDVFSSLKQG